MRFVKTANKSAREVFVASIARIGLVAHRLIDDSRDQSRPSSSMIFLSRPRATARVESRGDRVAAMVVRIERSDCPRRGFQRCRDCFRRSLSPYRSTRCELRAGAWMCDRNRDFRADSSCGSSSNLLAASFGYRVIRRAIALSRKRGIERVGDRRTTSRRHGE